MDDMIRKFDNRIKNHDPHIITLLAAIDGFRGEFKSSLRMTPQAIIKLRRSTLVTSAGASTRIEGANLNDEEVEKIMRGLAVSKFANRDSQEVQGYLETLQNVFDSFQTLPLRESVIKSIHNQRKSQETFGSDHDTIAPWLNFFLSVVKEQAAKALAHIEEETVEDILSPKQNEVWKHLSSVGEAAPGEIVKATGIALGTVRQSLSRLVKLGKIKRIGRGRGIRYVRI